MSAVNSHAAMADGIPGEHSSDLSKPKAVAPERKNQGWMCSSLLMALCCVTILILSGFSLSHLAEEQPWQQSPSSAASVDPGASVQPTTSDLLPSVPTETPSNESLRRLAPPEQFDVKGFKISDKPTERRYVLNITRDFALPGDHNKSMILINGRTPGPLIEANVGDSITVLVNNMMSEEATTIHWHGIDQRNSVWMDGVHGVTQCGIPPGENFTYHFDIVDQRGTFWYHSHLSLQNTEGLYGPLVWPSCPKRERIPEFERH